MSYKTNKSLTVPVWGGSKVKFEKCNLIWVGKFEGITAIKLKNKEDPIKIRLSQSEFWDDFYASRSY